MALIMVLIFTVLLYAMTSELVTTAQTAKLTGENDVLIARMRSHMRYVLGQTEEALLKFQGHFEIGTSGQLDEPTLRTMFGQPLPEGVTVERNPDKLSEAEFAAQCE